MTIKLKKRMKDLYNTDGSTTYLIGTLVNKKSPLAVVCNH